MHDSNLHLLRSMHSKDKDHQHAQMKESKECIMAYRGVNDKTAIAESCRDLGERVFVARKSPDYSGCQVGAYLNSISLPTLSFLLSFHASLLRLLAMNGGLQSLCQESILQYTK